MLVPFSLSSYYFKVSFSFTIFFCGNVGMTIFRSRMQISFKIFFYVLLILLVVNGGLSEWTPWSSCSRMCVRGVQTRVRQCNNPSPRCGGEPCGNGVVTKQTKGCMVCPSKIVWKHCFVHTRTYLNILCNTRILVFV